MGKTCKLAVEIGTEPGDMFRDRGQWWTVLTVSHPFVVSDDDPSGDSDLLGHEGEYMVYANCRPARAEEIPAPLTAEARRTLRRLGEYGEPSVGRGIGQGFTHEQ